MHVQAGASPVGAAARPAAVQLHPVPAGRAGGAVHGQLHWHLLQGGRGNGRRRGAGWAVDELKRVAGFEAGGARLGGGLGGVVRGGALSWGRGVRVVWQQPEGMLALNAGTVRPKTTDPKEVPERRLTLLASWSCENATMASAVALSCTHGAGQGASRLSCNLTAQGRPGSKQVWGAPHTGSAAVGARKAGQGASRLGVRPTWGAPPQEAALWCIHHVGRLQSGSPQPPARVPADAPPLAPAPLQSPRRPPPPPPAPTQTRRAPRCRRC